MSDAVLYAENIGGAKHWSSILRRGSGLRLVDVQGGANVGMLFYNPLVPSERYNAPDTLKCQHTFKLALGNCLYSDMGRIFCSIQEDDLQWHDTVCGNSTARLVERKWGAADYQTHRNDWRLNGHDSFLVEAGKYGLGARDLAANVNWFSKVSVQPEGDLVFASGHSRPGARLCLRFEMDTLVLLHTCAHPLDSSPAFPRKPVQMQVVAMAPATPGDACFQSCAENKRGFENTRNYVATTPERA